MVTKQMDDLTAELGQVENDLMRRAEIIAQIIRLGRLYLSLRGDPDLALQDR